MRQSNWHVITGAPCSGKTTVIRALHDKGFKVVQEVARAYMQKELARGRRMRQVRADLQSFEENILAEKVRIEASLDPAEAVFFDRGVPDSIAYFQHAGLSVKQPLAQSRRFRYRTVFFFERLDLFADRIRREDDETAESLARLITDGYRMLGYVPVVVPVMSVQRRVNLILDFIHGLP